MSSWVMPFLRDVTLKKKEKMKGRKGREFLTDSRLLFNYTLKQSGAKQSVSDRTKSQLYFTALMLKGVNIYPPACTRFWF